MKFLKFGSSNSCSKSTEISCRACFKKERKISQINHRGEDEGGGGWVAIIINPRLSNFLSAENLFKSKFELLRALFDF